MNVTEERSALFKAIAAAQGEFTTVEKNAKNPHFNSKFAPLDSIIEMIRPILPKHGLSVVQFTDLPESGGGVIIETVITHESGQFISGRLYMPTVKQDPQGYGSAITYGRRYALGAALGIVSDEDVDGNQAETPARAARAQQQPAAPANLDPKDAEHIDRIKKALHTLYAADKKAALDKVEELTSFVPRGKTEAERVKGVRDFTKLTGQRLSILTHSLEKLVPKEETLCNECRQPVTKHAASCPNNEGPPQ